MEPRRIKRQWDSGGLYSKIDEFQPLAADADSTIMRCSSLCSTPFRLTAILAFVAAQAFTLADATVQDAQAMLQQGKQAQALEHVNQLIAANPKDRSAKFFKGVILAEMNKLDEAAAVFLKLTEEAPELPEPYNNLAVIYAQQKQYDKARAALEMAIRTHPSYAVAHENLGDLYAKMARQAYDRALQIDAGNASAQSKLNLIREIISVNGRPASQPAQVAAAPNSAQTASRPALTPAPATAPQTGTTTSAATLGKSAAAPSPVSPPSSSGTAWTSSTASTAPSASAVTTPKSAEVVKTPASSESVAAKSADKVPSLKHSEEAKPSEKASQKADAKLAEAAAEKSSEDKRALQAAVQAWAAAWSSKNAREYLSFYAKDFEVPDHRNRADWEKERTERVTKPGAINVTLSDIEVSLKGDQAVVKFRQHYNSPGLKTTAGKTLDMVRRGGRWQIQEERIGR